MTRRCLTAVLFLACITGAITGATAAPNDKDKAPAAPEGYDQISSDAMRQSIGAPLRAELGSEAAVRLHENLVIVPHDPAVRLLTVQHKPIPPNFVAMVGGPQGVDSPGYIRFVPSGYVDADEILAWTPEDILDSLEDTVKRENQDRIKQGLQPIEARRWIRPPRYDPETHLLSWAALVIPESAPKESDGEIVFHGVAFGRDGYIEVTADASVEAADAVGGMVDTFLLGVAFNPGKTYADFQKGDKLAPKGVAGVMGIDSLHKARDHSTFLSSDILVAVVGGLVALVGALALFLYIQRYMRRLARRV